MEGADPEVKFSLFDEQGQLLGSANDRLELEQVQSWWPERPVLAAWES